MILHLLIVCAGDGTSGYIPNLANIVSGHISPRIILLRAHEHVANLHPVLPEWKLDDAFFAAGIALHLLYR